jgi:membrane protein required for colicin V production
VNTVDGAVLVVLDVVALRGYLRGLFRELFAIVGIVAGVFVAMAHGGEVAGQLLARQLVWPVVALYVATAGLFVGVYLSATIAGIIVRRVARALFLGPIDRIGGALLGMARGAALAGIALALAPKVLAPDAGLLRGLDQSTLGRPLAALGQVVLDAGRRFVPVPAGQAV